MFCLPWLYSHGVYMRLRGLKMKRYGYGVAGLLFKIIGKATRK
jgi:hypothetical protein